MYTLEQTNEFSVAFYAYLMDNDTENLDEYFISADDSPLLDKQIAKIIIDQGFLSINIGAVYDFKEAPEIREIKKSLEFLFSDAQDKILNNTLFPLFLQFLHYGDIEYCEHLIQVAKDKGVHFNFIEAMNVLLELLYQDLLLDFEEEQEYMELVYKKWVGILKLLKEYGLSTEYDVVPVLEQFEPESEEDEEYYLRIVSLFADEGFSFQNGLESENSFIKTTALNQKLRNEIPARSEIKRPKPF